MSKSKDALDRLLAPKHGAPSSLLQRTLMEYVATRTEADELPPPKHYDAVAVALAKR